MSDLIVTFTTTVARLAPVAVAENPDTEVIAIGASSAAGSKEATGPYAIVSLYAQAACWVKVGPSPEAAVGEDWYMGADDRLDLAVSIGSKIAVIQA